MVLGVHVHVEAPIRGVSAVARGEAEWAAAVGLIPPSGGRPCRPIDMPRQWIRGFRGTCGNWISHTVARESHAAQRHDAEQHASPPQSRKSPVVVATSNWALLLVLLLVLGPDVGVHARRRAHGAASCPVLPRHAPRVSPTTAASLAVTSARHVLGAAHGARHPPAGCIGCTRCSPTLTSSHGSCSRWTHRVPPWPLALACTCVPSAGPRACRRHGAGTAVASPARRDSRGREGQQHGR